MEEETATKPTAGGRVLRLLATLLPVVGIALTMHRTYARGIERQTREVLRVEHELVVQANAQVRAARRDAAHPERLRDAERARDEAIARYERVLATPAGKKVCGPSDMPCSAR